MSLTELSTAIPEKLPAQLDFADLGTQFQAVQSKQQVHIQPSSGNTFFDLDCKQSVADLGFPSEAAFVKQFSDFLISGFH